MFRNFTLLICCFVALCCGNSSVLAFSLNGPNESWQTPVNGYSSGNLSAPMNINGEFRWNVPAITYGFDPSFLAYFGTNGVKAVEDAVAVFNGLPKSSEMDLNTFSFSTIRQNPRAYALHLLDVKTYAMRSFMYELGVLDPEIYVFCLRNHIDPPNGLPDYFVIQRNYDPVTLAPSFYINGQLWTYTNISHTANPHIAHPMNSLVDRLQGVTTKPVSTRSSPFGYYFTGLTYDDAGAIRYLLSTNNLNVEKLHPSVFEISTNKTTPRQIDTLDLALLTTRSRSTTNDIATLLAFPGYTNLHVISTNVYLTNLITTNITSYFTNYPYGLGVEPQQVFTTNFTTNVTLAFDYSFDNVITNSVYTRPVIVQQVDVVPSPTYQPGQSLLVTNITSISTNYEVGGDFYILPNDPIHIPGGQTNRNIGFNLISTQAVGVVTVTNWISTVVSENVAVTNLSSTPIRLDTLDLGQFYLQTHWTTNNPAAVLELYPGLLITQTNAHFTNVVTTNISSYFTNFPSPIPPGPLQVFTTNYATNVVLVYDYTFGNVAINGEPNHFSSFAGWEQNYPANPPALIGGVNQFPSVNWQTATIRKLELVRASVFTPGGSTILTNVLEEYTDILPFPSGDILIVPTNVLGYVTNALVLHGVATVTNIDVYSTAQLMTNDVDAIERLRTLDLTTFIQRTRTNSPAELLAIPDYADLLITSANNYLSPLRITNYVRYLTNYPYDAAGAPPHEETNIFITFDVQTNWVYTFANVVTNTHYKTGLVTLQQEITSYDPYAVAGSLPQTRTNSTTFSANYDNGSIYIVPTNLFGYIILGGVTNIIPVTEVLSSVTNQLQTTNVDQTVLIRYFTEYTYFARPVEILTTNDFATNDFGIRREITYNISTNTYDVFPIELVNSNAFGPNSFSRVEVVSYYTNMTLGYYPIVRQEDTNAFLRPGVDKVSFVRMFNQTLITTNYYPFTTNYTDRYYVTENGTNVVLKQRTVTRTVMRPDILFTAPDTDLVDGVPVFPGWITAAAGWENFGSLNGNHNQASNGGDLPFHGPGIIPGSDNYNGDGNPINISLNNIAPIYFNFGSSNAAFLSQFPMGNLSQAWASFDGSTNEPAIYPLGINYLDLENQVVAPQNP
jgi:hypothetical protein